MDCAICHQPYSDTHECKKPNAPGEGSELPALGLFEVAQALVEAMGTCHICKGLIILQEYAVHCEDCSYYCENHDGPGCVPIYELHRRLKAALSSPQQEEFRWIPCEQELPSIGQTVIVQGGIAYRVEDEWISQTGGASGRPIMWPVTHWAKIPDIPAPPVTAEGKDRG